MRILVTGATGFIGSRVVRMLVERGHAVRALIRSNRRAGRLAGLPMETVWGDLFEPPSLVRAARGCEACIHLAGVSGWEQIAGDHVRESIFDGTLHLLDALQAAGTGRFVYVSSTAAVDGTLAPALLDENSRFNLVDSGLTYAVAKHDTEREILRRANGFAPIIVNPAETYGAKDDDWITAGSIRDILRGWPAFAVRGGSSIVHVEDVAAGVVAALERGRARERYILGGENLTIRQIVRLTLELAALRRPIVSVPHALLRLTADVCSALNVRPPLEPALIDYLRRFWFVDSAKARDELGYTPRQAHETLAPTVDWVLEQLANDDAVAPVPTPTPAATKAPATTAAPAAGGVPVALAQGETLLELLECRAAEPGAGTGYTFLRNGVGEQKLSFAALDLEARLLAARLRARADPGDRVLLYFPPGLEFLVGLFASFHAGLIGVPAPSPRGRVVTTEEFAPVAAVIADCAPRLSLTTESVLASLPAEIRRARNGPEWLSVGLGQTGSPERLERPGPDALAYLQYTSGSTSSPKGVMVSHRNVMANLAAIYERLDHPDDAVGVSWLPHFHDMGLTGGLLSSLYGGFPFTLMAPADFLTNPLRWLRAITAHRGTWSGGPNFAYELCCRRVRPKDLEELDLSTWKVAATGSEPVRRATIDRFCETFAPAGFRREAMCPYYGLAETVVFATGTAAGAPPRTVPGRLPGNDGAVETGCYALCGTTGTGHDVAIVDPETRRRVPPGEAGEIWLSGPSVAQGYWRREQESDEVFRAHFDGDSRTWLRTGDTGFLHAGELAVTGRLKELVIVAGTNHAPQDIEATVEAAHPAVRPGNAAAFAVEGATDRLVVAAEVAKDLGDVVAGEVIEAIRAAVAERHGIAVDAVTLLRGRMLPKTSSGKLRRYAARDQWASGFGDVVAEWPPRNAHHCEPTGVARSDPSGETIRTAAVRHVRRILGDSDCPVELAAPIHRLGLGSLQLAELKNALEVELGIEIPFPQLLQGCSIATLADSLGRGPVEASASAASRHPFETYVNPAIGELLRRFNLDQPFVRGEGAWLERADGTRILDAIAGYGALPLGHNPEPIWSALSAVRDRSEPSLVQPSMNDAAGELAARLIALAPPGFAHVTFTNSGAETTEAALKLTRAATGRRAFLSTCNGFHGKTLGALSVTGKSSFQQPFGAPIFDVGYVPFGDAAALESELRRRGRDYAAFIVEPIQGEGGIVEPPAGYLAAAAALCAEHGVKIVVDEIQTGLGRTGALFACAAERVVPDVLLVAKALGGGLLSIGAMLYRADCYTEDFARNHSSTFAANSLACRAGLAMLDLLTAGHERLVDDVANRGGRLRDALQRLADRWPHVVASVRGRGYLLGIELSKRRDAYGRDSLLGVLAEQETLAPLLASYLLNVEHVRVAPTLLSHSVIRIEPPLNFTDEEVDLLVAALERGLGHLAERNTPALVNHLLAQPRPNPPPRTGDAPIRRVQVATGTTERRFAFLAHPIDATSYAELDPSLAGFTPAELAELEGRLHRAIEPFVAAEAEVAGAGAAAVGQFIIVPRTSEQLARGAQGSAAPLRDALAIARAGGAEIVGLGGYVSIASSGGMDLASAGVPLTTGNSYTAICGADAVIRAAELVGLDLSGATVGIVGAGGSIGQALSFLMAEQAGRLVLIGNPSRRQASLEALLRTAETVVDALLSGAAAEAGELATKARAHRARTGAAAGAVAAWLIEFGLLETTVDIAEALRDCDIVLTATSCPEPLVPGAALRHGAIVCDLSRPRNLSPRLAEIRPDVLVLDGGLVAVPGSPDLGWSFGLPRGVAFACMCEPMILALERRFTAAPLGLGVPLDYLQALRGWARKHGFELAELRSWGRRLTDLDWHRQRTVRRAAVQEAALNDIEMTAGEEPLRAAGADPPTFGVEG